KIAVAEHPAGGIIRRRSRDGLAGKAGLQRRLKQGHVIRLQVEGGLLADPIGQGANHPQDGDLRAAESQVVADEAGGDWGDAAGHITIDPYCCYATWLQLAKRAVSGPQL